MTRFPVRVMKTRLKGCILLLPALDELGVQRLLLRAAVKTAERAEAIKRLVKWSAAGKTDASLRIRIVYSPLFDPARHLAAVPLPALAP